MSLEYAYVTVKCNLFYQNNSFLNVVFQLYISKNNRDNYINFMGLKGVYFGKNDGHKFLFKLDNVNNIEILEDDYEEVTGKFND